MSEKNKNYRKEVLKPEEQKIFDFFYQSFRFSQGDNATHRLILQWLGSNEYFKDLPLSFEPPQYIINLLSPGKHRSDAGRQSDPARLRIIIDMWNEMYKSKYAKEDQSPHNLLTQLLKEILNRELKYQYNPRPSGEGKNTFASDSINDPHASFIRKFLLYRETTGFAEFDLMFKELEQIFYFYLDEKNVSINISDVSNIINHSILWLKKRWEDNHPGETFFPSETTN